VIAADAAPASEVGASRGRLVRNMLLLFGGQVASWAFALLWLFFVPRKLGPAPIGELVIATSITAILGTFVNQGAGTLLTKEIARDPGVAGRLVGGAALMRLACVIPAFVVITVYALLLHFNSEQTLLVWLATAGMLTAALSGAVQAAFTGIERMEYIAYANLVGNGLTSILGIVLVLGGGGVVALLVLDLILTMLVLVLNLIWARRIFVIKWRGALTVIPHIVRGGLSYWIGGLFFVTYLWIDSVLLSTMAPAKVVGWYGVPTQLFTAILMVSGVLGTAWFPRLAAAFKHGPQRLIETGRPAVELVMVISLPIAIGTVLVAGPLVQLLYGSAFMGAVPVLMVLGITVVPTFFNMIAYQMLLASNRQVGWIKVVALATVLNVVLNFLLVPHFQASGNGAIGAAVSLLISELFEAFGALMLLPWLLQASFGSRVLRAAAAAGLMAATVVVVAPLGLLAEIACGVVCFTVFAILLRVATTAELAEVRALGTRFRARRSGGAAA
jgi:O-antigen/teichoic acid export membrane protein